MRRSNWAYWVANAAIKDGVIPKRFTARDLLFSLAGEFDTGKTLGETPMPVEVVMPQMGESIFEGTVTKWLKKPGDRVQRDEPLFEISTDKVDAEIPAPASGVLQEIKVAEGATVQVNTVVAVIGGPGGA